MPVDWQAQRDMFRRDRLIERNDKRRRDGVHIKVLTHELVKELPKPVQSGVVADTGPSVTTDLSEVAAMARGSVKSCAAPPLISKPATKPPPPPATELLGVPQEKTTVLRTKGTTWKRQNQQDLAKMERELNRPNNYQSTSQLTRKKDQTSRCRTNTIMAPILNLGLVSANGFSLNIRQPNVEVFSITLHGLDRIVEDRR